MTGLERFIRGLPKAELHVHIEGCIEPAMMFALADRNGLSLRWDSPAALQAAYRFRDLQAFLDLYFEGCRVLVRERDFYDVTRAYLERAHADAVVHAELFIGPQSFVERGVPLAAVMDGVLGAIDDAREALGIAGGLIVSTHRHRSEADAFALLDSVMPWRDRILGIGMGGAERPHPPSKFVRYFSECRARGLRTCIHAGEEGPADYVRQALDLLGVDRIDHGIACMDDAGLVAALTARQVPLTVCPVSNVMLNVVGSLATHPLRRMLEAGLRVTVNSDDPPYFGAYLNDTLVRSQQALGLRREDVVTLARNSLTSVFAPPSVVDGYLRRLERYVAEAPPA